VNFQLLQNSVEISKFRGNGKISQLAEKNVGPMNQS